MGFSGLSKKVGVLIALGYGVGIYLLSTVVTDSSSAVYSTIINYNFVMFSVMSLIIIYAGLHTIREWKLHQKKPYPILLGNLMLFAGIYFLSSVILLPNINQVLLSPMKPYDMTSMTTLIYVLVFMVALVVIGFVKTKRESIWR